jgi:hypothetical protein
MRNFICGMVVMIAITSLFQDIMGKEAYLYWAATHWTPPEKTVPLALILLVIAIVGVEK